MTQIQKCYSVHDVKAETYMPPFFVPSKGLAIRAFEDCVNSDTHHFGQHPSDYTLFEIGAFDTDTGEFIQAEKISVGNGVDFVNPLKSQGVNDVPQSSRSPDQNS
nr:MAG: nonstructural protein [Microvirus sp.]